jgi:hypothetical protein
LLKSRPSYATSNWKESKEKAEELPALAPSYIYAFFALVAVSSILVSSYATYTTTLRTILEVEQLKNLLNHVASKGYELAALTAATNSTLEASLQLPTTIGNKQYWIRLRNEGSKAWVEGALGTIHTGNITNRVYLPKTVVAMGNYSSGYGPVLLKSYLDGTSITLSLSSWRDSL